MSKEESVQETKEEVKEVQGKKCFIITPIGSENSNTFRKAKGVIESVIKPILTEYGFDDVKPAYEINVSGMINTQIINRIIDDDLVIANLTGNNPNVMYELCLRHVVAKPIIHICEDGTSLPFDIKDSRTIFYKDDMLGVKELENKLRKFVAEIEYDIDQMDNPIYTASKYGKLLKETREGTKENEILRLLLDISNKVDGDSFGNSRSRSVDYGDEDNIYAKHVYNALAKISSDDIDNINEKVGSDGMIEFEELAQIVDVNASVLKQILIKQNVLKKSAKYLDRFWVGERVVNKFLEFVCDCRNEKKALL